MVGQEEEEDDEGAVGEAHDLLCEHKTAAAASAAAASAALGAGGRAAGVYSRCVTVTSQLGCDLTAGGGHLGIKMRRIPRTPGSHPCDLRGRCSPQLLGLKGSGSSARSSTRCPPVGTFRAGAPFGPLGHLRANEWLCLGGKDEAFALALLLLVKFLGRVSVRVLQEQSQAINLKKRSMVSSVV